MRLLSIGDCIVPGRYHLHSRFQHAANFCTGGHWVFLVDSSVAAGPLNLLCNCLPGGRVDTLIVSGGRIMLDGKRIEFHAVPRYNSTLSLTAAQMDRLAAALPLICSELLTRVEPGSLPAALMTAETGLAASPFQRAFTERILHGVNLLRSGRFSAGAALIRGCGPGLTPAGDDLLAGILLGMRLRIAAGEREFLQAANAIFRAAGSTNPFSRVFLRLSNSRRVPAAMKRLIIVAGEACLSEVPAAVEAVTAMGATSGADWLCGLLLSLQRDFTAVPAGQRDFVRARRPEPTIDPPQECAAERR